MFKIPLILILILGNPNPTVAASSSSTTNDPGIKCYISATEGGYNIRGCRFGCNNRTFNLPNDNSFVAGCAKTAMPAGGDPSTSFCAWNGVEHSCDCFMDYCNCLNCVMAGLTMEP